MPTRKLKEKNIRTITKIGKRSYAVTLPIEVVRQFKWKERQKVVLKINRKTKSITIKDWRKK